MFNGEPNELEVIASAASTAPTEEQCVSRSALDREEADDTLPTEVQTQLSVTSSDFAQLIPSEFEEIFLGARVGSEVGQVVFVFLDEVPESVVTLRATNGFEDAVELRAIEGLGNTTSELNGRQERIGAVLRHFHFVAIGHTAVTA